MEIINATPKTVERLITKVESLKMQVERLKNRSSERRLKRWLDSQEVLFTLGISARTLQAYRDKGQLPYSQVGSKFYYKSEDVQRLVLNSKA